MCEESLSVGGANLVFLTVKCRKRINASPSINKSTERHTRVPHYQSAIFYTIATTLQPALLPDAKDRQTKMLPVYMVYVKSVKVLISQK